MTDKPEAKRIAYGSHGCLRGADTLIVKTRTGERKIPPNKWRINRNTPVGDDAELWEIKPYSGRRSILWSDLLAVERQP